MSSNLRMSAAVWKKKQRLRMKNKGKRNKRTLGGKKMHTAMSTYRKLIRMNKRPRKASTVRKMLRTRKIRMSRFGASYGVRDSVMHSETFMHAMNELAVAANCPDIVADILEAIDPSVTGTKVGLYGLDITESLDKDAVLGEAFLDFFAISEDTLVFVFGNDQKVNETAINNALSAHGKVSVLAKPGDALSEDEKSDVFFVSLVVEGSKIEGVKTEMDEGFEIKEGEAVIDESKFLSDEDYAKQVVESATKILEA
jgi:hypothetical protein